MGRVCRLLVAHRHDDSRPSLGRSPLTSTASIDSRHPVEVADDRYVESAALSGPNGFDHLRVLTPARSCPVGFPMRDSQFTPHHPLIAPPEGRGASRPDGRHPARFFRPEFGREPRPAKLRREVPCVVVDEQGCGASGA